MRAPQVPWGTRQAQRAVLARAALVAEHVDLQQSPRLHLLQTIATISWTKLATSWTPSSPTPPTPTEHMSSIITTATGSQLLFFASCGAPAHGADTGSSRSVCVAARRARDPVMDVRERASPTCSGFTTTTAAQNTLRLQHCPSSNFRSITAARMCRRLRFNTHPAAKRNAA